MGNTLVASAKKEVAKMTFSNFMASPAITKKVNEVVQGKDGQRFITALVSAVASNPKLAECNQMSIFSAALVGESLKLSPSPQLGQYYLVPYKKNKTAESNAQFQIGYKGYIQLAIRSGQYRKIIPLPIKEGELVSWNPLTEEIELNLIQDDKVRENTKTTGYYFTFELVNGFKKSMYWSYEKMLNHADIYSKAFSEKSYIDLLAGKIPDDELWKYSSFWYKNFDEMALKTLIRQGLSKWGVLSIEMQNAYTNDQAVIKDGVIDYVDSADITGYQEPPALPVHEEEPEQPKTTAKTLVESVEQ